MKEQNAAHLTEGVSIHDAKKCSFSLKIPSPTLHQSIGVRAGGARGAAAPPNFGQLRFFGQLEKIWAKPVFKDVSMFFISLKRQIFSILI